METGTALHLAQPKSWPSLMHKLLTAVDEAYSKQNHNQHARKLYRVGNSHDKHTIKEDESWSLHSWREISCKEAKNDGEDGVDFVNDNLD